MRPIPNIVLVHSATLYHRTGVDSYAKPLYGSAIALSKVRFEVAKRSALKNLGEMKDDKLLMFFDCVNSSPKAEMFSPLDKIVYNGNTYIVRDVADFSPHHYEVFLK